MMRRLIWSFGVFLVMALLAGCNDGGDRSAGPAGPQTVVVMGDSITSDVNYPGADPWRVVLAQMEPNLSIRDYSASSSTSRDGLAKIGRALEREQPDVVISFYGAVDAIQGVHGTTKENLRGIINASKAAGAKVLVCNVLPMFGSRGIHNGKVDLLNPDIAAVCSETGAKLVNVHRELPRESSYPDGLHPDAEGQRVLAMVIRERL